MTDNSSRFFDPPVEYFKMRSSNEFVPQLIIKQNSDNSELDKSNFSYSNSLIEVEDPKFVKISNYKKNVMGAMKTLVKAPKRAALLVVRSQGGVKRCER